MIKPKTITYIAGVARSGTSWLGQIFNSAPDVSFKFQPLFAYEFKNNVTEDSTSEEFNSLIYNIFQKDSEFLNQNDKKKNGDYPTFIKDDNLSHLVFKENRYQHIIEPMMRKCSDLKLVGIIRNPNATLNSWMKNPKEFPIGYEPLKEWRYGNCKNKGNEDFFGYYKWKEVANLYLDLKEKWPDRVYIVHYEELVENPENTIKDLFTFCNIEYSEQTKSFLVKSSTLHNDSPYSVFKDKKVVTQWKDELNTYITEEISFDLSGTRLEKFIKK